MKREVSKKIENKVKEYFAIQSDKKKINDAEPNRKLVRDDSK